MSAHKLLLAGGGERGMRTRAGKRGGSARNADPGWLTGGAQVVVSADCGPGVVREGVQLRVTHGGG